MTFFNSNTILSFHLSFRIEFMYERGTFSKNDAEKYKQFYELFLHFVPLFLLLFCEKQKFLNYLLYNAHLKFSLRQTSSKVSVTFPQDLTTSWMLTDVKLSYLFPLRKLCTYCASTFFFKNRNRRIDFLG